MQELVLDLAACVEPLASSLLAVVTGAGISRASGIPTFRGSEPGAVWKQHDVEMATASFFARDPVTQWRWYLERFAAIERAQPNAAHYALAGLERWQTARGGDFLLVTQNIDPLHERAGTKSLVKVHGTGDRLRCSHRGCDYGAPAGSLPRAAVDLAAFRSAPTAATLPRCPQCGGLLRAHVLFFDEYYHEHSDYQFVRVEEAAATAAFVLFVGTSFSVGVTDLFVRSAYDRQVPMASIDPAGAESLLSRLVRRLAAPAEELLPALCDHLGVDAAPVAPPN